MEATRSNLTTGQIFTFEILQNLLCNISQTRALAVNTQSVQRASGTCGFLNSFDCLSVEPHEKIRE